MSFISGEDEEIEAEEVATNEDGRDDGVVVESYNGVIMLEDEGEESEDHDDDDDDDDDEGKLLNEKLNLPKWGKGMNNT